MVIIDECHELRNSYTTSSPTSAAAQDEGGSSRDPGGKPSSTRSPAQESTATSGSPLPPSRPELKGVTKKRGYDRIEMMMAKDDAPLLYMVTGTPFGARR